MSFGKGKSSGNDHFSGNMESRVSFRVGEKIKSFKELESKLKRFEMATSTKLWIRDSRNVENARKRTTRHLSDALKYYQVSFRCIHG